MNIAKKHFLAIKAINPNAEFSIMDNDLDNITWLNGTTPISKSDIENKIIEVQADYDAKQYQRDRVYPSIQDQLDMQYHDAVDGTTTWKDAIAKVKADNPKS
jgi:hypothetical protein